MNLYQCGFSNTGRALALSCGLVIGGMVSAAVADPAADKPVNYIRDIKPILSNSCYACHGPDEGQRQADLRLDLRDVAIQEAIKPGDAAGSRLIERVSSQDPDEAMPPADSKIERLTPKQIDLLARWINEGAAFDQHWAYVKPARPPATALSDASWPRNPIDFFIAAAHEEQGLQPSPDADRVTLIRRLSFDLTGLPPAPEEAAAFDADPEPEAYERLVDRLLDSAHYGERMAMYWLDLVRYADTNGIHGDNHHDVAPYRDYVIAAFNNNVPFDRFTVEQLAGDLLADADMRTRIASGYNRLLMTTREGGAQPKEYLAKYAADRVRNASSVWMGSTLGCAECHDHKFDPFATRDFYRFASFFADIKETAVGEQEQTRVLPEDAEARLKQLDEAIAALQQRIESPSPELEAARAAWEARLRDEVAAVRQAWQPIEPVQLASQQGQTFEVQPDQSVLVRGDNPANDTYAATLSTELTGMTGIRLEVLTHPELSEGGLSRGGGNFVLTGLTVEVATPADAEPRPIAIASAAADYEQQGYPVAAAIDDVPETGWAVEGHQQKQSRQAVFNFAEPVAGGPGTMLTVHLKHESQHAGHNIGRFRLALTTAASPPLKLAGIPDSVAAAVESDEGARTPEQQQALTAHWRATAPELAPLRDEIAAHESQKQELIQAAPLTLVSMSVEPRVMRVLPRGNWLDETGEIVTPAVPAFMSQLAVGERRATRLDLAEWIVSPENPLTARVFVNRLWKLCFGRGIVRSLDDFGSQGTLPTHAALLDWLAMEFVESGWNVKHMLKLMVMSSAYRQSSYGGPERRERDAANRWLARQGRFRLDAEMVRDNALAVSGLLVRKLGGPSAKPYQPAGYWAHLNFPKREYQADHGEGLYRRGLYTYWCRTFLHPSMLAFDAPTREECTVERPRSSTPLQALALLNDPTYVEAARVFAERIVREGGTDQPARLNWAFRQALLRDATAQEHSVLAALYGNHLEQYSGDRDAAKQLVSTGEWPVPADLDVAELAAWTSLARVIFNLHETITRD